MWMCVVMIVSFVASYYMQQQAAKQSARVPTAGTIDVPTAQADRPIMVLFGSARIKSPNCAWYGNTWAEAIQK